jgi:hypothetical protein
MSVLVVEDIIIREDYVTVVAMVEDARILYQQDLISPAEYCPALCQASFYVDEDEQIPTDEGSFIDYLNELDLDWQLLPNDYF